MKLVVFDTETTDLRPGQICQLSYLIAADGRVAGKNLFFSVDEMNESSQAVHGMSMERLEELSGGERFEDRAQEIFDDFSACELLVGHNVAFDDRFLRTELTRAGYELPRIRTFCTMNYFTGDMQLRRKFRTGRPKPPKLIELAEYMELKTEDVEKNSEAWFGGGAAAHDARFDTAMTYMCLAEGARRGMIRGVL